MTDLRHAPTAPEAAVRPPDPAVADLQPDLSDLRPEMAARALAMSAAGGAGSGTGSPTGGRPNVHGLPPGAVGAAALLGIQRAAGNRAAASLVLGPRPLARPAARAAGPAVSSAVGTPGSLAGGAVIDAAVPTPGEATGTHDGPGPAAIDALHASGPPQAPAAAAAQRLVVQRDGPQQVTPSFVIPIEPGKAKWDLTSKTSYVRGSIAF